MAKYVYAITELRDENLPFDFLLYISEKSCWDESGLLQDYYEDAEEQELNNVLSPQGIYSAMESVYESTNLDREQLRAYLDSTGLFEYDLSFEAFIR